ncbi:MAG: hypothetical protein U1E29_09190 [Coriobacteriia bacterium]|nr:hypothetical protein [Coriobacteriia bacterium]
MAGVGFHRASRPVVTCSNMEDAREQLIRLIDAVFRDSRVVTRLDVVMRADALDVTPRIREIVDLLPPARYTRLKLCDQLNSAITGHGWARELGTVD